MMASSSGSADLAPAGSSRKDDRPPSKKRRRELDGPQWQLDCTKANKLLTAAEYRKLLQQCPTGNLLDPTTEDTPRTKTGRAGRRWMPHRAHQLPYLKSFHRQLQADASILLHTFTSEWKQIRATLDQDTVQAESSCNASPVMSISTAAKSALAGPLALFVHIWRSQGWHLIQLQWGEEAETRARFFEATSRAFLSPLYSSDGVESHDQLLTATAAIYALYLLHVLQPTPPVPIPGLHNDYHRWSLLPGQQVDEDWNPYAEAGKHRIKVEVDVLEKMFALPESSSAALGLSAKALTALHPFCEPQGCVSANDDRLDFAADTSYVLRRMCGERPVKVDSSSTRRGFLAFHILPSSSIAGIRNPPHLPYFEEVSEEEKQRQDGKWGYLTANVVEEGSTSSRLGQGDAVSIRLARADNILIRAAEQLRQPLNAATLPFVQSATTGSASAIDKPIPAISYDFTPRDTLTSWAGSWIEVPFRSKNLTRRAKWEASRGQVERVRRSYERVCSQLAGSVRMEIDSGGGTTTTTGTGTGTASATASNLLNIDLSNLLNGSGNSNSNEHEKAGTSANSKSENWSGRSIQEHIHQSRHLPLTNIEEIFRRARDLTGDTILRGMAIKQARGEEEEEEEEERV